MITLENIHKKYKNIVLFEDVNATFVTGKKSFIKGINGSGKSVLLKMIVGYSTPDSGKILIDDYELGRERDFIQNAGVSINAPEFMRGWTGWENLKYLANIKKDVTDEHILSLVSRLHLEEDIYKKYRTYSLGMRQKMRIIQAFMTNPQYLILDEPFDALDFKSKQIVSDLLEEYLSEDASRSFIFTSHNDAIEDFADAVFEVSEKRLIQVE